MLYGPDDKPVKTKPRKKTFSQYLAALSALDSSPENRSRDPLSNHAWVYAAAMIRAINLSQAPFLIYRETTKATNQRRAKTKNWRAGRGENRRAIQRHLQDRTRFNGEKVKSLELDLENPLTRLFIHPNDVISGAELWQITSLWMTLRGECFWLKMREDGNPLDIGEDPGQIWPLSPDLFTPNFAGNRLASWTVSLRGKHVPYNASDSFKVVLNLWEVVQFKYPNPLSIHRGITPLAAATSGIDLDMQVKSYNRSLLKNGAEPGGIYSYEGDLDQDEEELEYQKLEDRHRGSLNANRLTILNGAWKYQPTGLKPADLQHHQTLMWDRDEIFAVLRVPKSTAGVTDQLNYATQLGQDRNLWDKSLIPDIRLFESVIDSTIFFNQPDTIVGAFDLSNVEALRVGMNEQADLAKKFLGADFHMPPSVALEVAGIENIPDYPAKDVSIVSPMLVPLSDVTDPLPPTKSVKKAGSKRNRWKAFVAAQQPLEKAMIKAWKRWVADMRDRQLSLFDENTKSLSPKQIDALMLDIKDMKRGLGSNFRPLYQSGLEITYDMVLSEVSGIPLFEIDDPRILKAMENRFTRLIGTAPKTLRKKLKRSLIKASQNGETIQQMRGRIGETFKIAAGSGKTLAIARTESASLMNGIRTEMFKAQGVKKMEWVTAGDEHVREDHAIFGDSGPHDQGYDYLNDIGGGDGTLEFPGDPNGPPEQVINCRCILVPSS